MTASKVLEHIETAGVQLRRLAGDRSALDVAQFQFIGFDDIRRAYGDRWRTQKARICGVAETFLRSRMDPSDLLISAGNGFVVIFGDATGPDAEVAAGQLAHGLNAYFLGSEGQQPAPQLEVACHSVPTDELVACLAEATLTRPDARSNSTEPFSLSALEWRFQPVWDVKHETLSSWYVAPYLKKTGRRFPGYQFEAEPARAEQLAAVDEYGLWVSEHAITDLLALGKQALVGASIHARSLANDVTRANVLLTLDRLDKSLFRYRIIKIAGVAPGFPRLYLNEIVQMLKARSSNVVIGAAWNEPDIGSLVGNGASAVGVTAPNLHMAPTVHTALKSFIAKAAADCARAHAEKVRFFVEGAITSTTAVQLAAIGVDSLSSPRIWPATGYPDAMLKWPAARLLA